MKEITGITNVLCQVLQQKSQDILNAFLLQKKLIQKLRDNGWDNFLKNIVSFSKKSEIDIPY
jgi:hypothetical protein